MGWWDGLEDALFGIFATISDVISDFLEDKFINPFLDLLLYTPKPMRCASADAAQYPNCEQTPAIFSKPHNGMWTDIYNAAWGDMMIVSVVILAILYLASNLLSSLPIGSYEAQQSRNNIVTTLLLLPSGWIGGAILLHVMDGIARSIAGSANLTGIFSGLIGAIGAGVATPGLNVLSTLMGAIDLIVLLIAMLLYLGRVMLLVGVMYGMPLLITFRFTGIPVLTGIADTILKMFIKMSFLPILTAVGIKLTAIMFNGGDLTLTGGPSFGGLLRIILVILLPIASIAGFYLVMQSSLGRGAALATYATKQKLGSKSAASLGEGVGDTDTSLGDYAASGEDRISDLTRSAPSAVQQGYGATKHRAQTGSWSAEPTNADQPSVSFSPWEDYEYLAEQGQDPRFDGPNDPDTFELRNSGSGPPIRWTDNPARGSVLEQASQAARRAGYSSLESKARLSKGDQSQSGRAARRKALREKYGK
ncbi:hypothetical protein [Halorussus sp. AFM4]|uniref:hypothetical protein n=1 Tax=Halorussus sp. AFM4 TaxID=3421651 RepID=UPI003EB712E3